MGRALLQGTRNTPSPTSVLLVAASGSFLAFLDSTIVNVAFPNIEASFPAATVGTLSWVLNAYNIVFAAFLVAAGRITDLIGRRRAFSGGIALFTLASALCAIATNVDMLVAFRLLQGFGAAMLVPASLALVLNAYDAEHRSHGIGLYGAASALAAGLGPPIGGALVEVANWRLCFLVNVPLGIAAMLAARRFVVESRAPGRRRKPDLLGALLVGVGLGCLTLGTVKGGDYGWTNSKTLAAYLLAAVAFAGFAVSSRNHPSPLIDPRLMRIRSFSVSSLATTLAGIGFYAYLLTHILWLNYIWGYSLLKAGLAVAPGALVATVVAARVGKIADRHGHVPVVVPGALVWAASYVWYVVMVPLHPDFLHTWLPGQLVSGIGVGCVLPILGSGALSRVPQDNYATASAVISSARQLGAALGIAILVVVIGTPNPLTFADHLRHGWEISAGAFVLVAVVTAFARDPRPAQETAVEVADAAPAVDVTDLVPAQDRVAAHEPVLAVEAPAGDGGWEDLPLFRGMAPVVLAEIERAMSTVELPAGEVLVAQGEVSDDLWVVRRGRLEVIRDGVVVSVLGNDALVGELAFLTEAPRSATVRALRDTTLLRLSRESFERVCERHPAAMRSVAATLARRLAAPPAVVSRTSPAAVVAVMGTSPHSVTALVTRELVAQLQQWLTVAAPGRVTPAGLEAAELQADLVVLTADSEDDPAWREFCLRASDRRVFIHAGTGLPDRPDREEGGDLVFLGRLPAGAEAAAWHRQVRPRSRTAVASATDPAALAAGLRPLAARLAGRSLGLVLAGGGARAFAHLGVLEVLEEQGITVDRIAGASVGTALAAAWAVGRSAAEVDGMAYDGFVRMRPFSDYTLPISGLSRGRRTVAFAERVFGDLLIEELPREFRAVSVDLLRRERFVHDSGRVVDAVAASLRLPGLYPPYRIDNRLHVDGGVLDNLPVTTLTEPYEGPVVAVSIGFGGAGGEGREARRTSPPRMPVLADTVLRCLMMGSAAAAEEARRSADLVISPASDGVGLLEFHQIDTMRASGRAATLAVLPELRALLGARGRLSPSGAGQPNAAAAPTRTPVGAAVS